MLSSVLDGKGGADVSLCLRISNPWGRMTSLDENGEISFGRFRLDLRRRELCRDGRPIRLRRRSLDILCALASANGELVRKDELMERVGRIVL